jgi:phosphoribosylanthranilate isomerase
MKIKICGLRDMANIKDVATYKPDYMGFICYNRSPRYISDMHVETLNGLPETIIKTAVFVNETLENIGKLIEKFGFDAIQLHGNESPEFCENFKGKVTVIKAFGVDDSFDFAQLDAYKNSVDFFMFDTKTEKHGGSGQVFNWGVLDRYTLDVPFFLSGGLSLENLPAIKQITHPAFYAVDLNSRFEIEPGLKDINRLKQAFELLR